MGTINYGSSNYITIGYKPEDPATFLQDPDFLEWIESEYPETDPEEMARETAAAYQEDCYIECENLLKAYSFYYYHVTIKYGYYEGFYIDIENNFGICYNDCYDRPEAQKEITKIKQFLIDCANLGLVEVWPGWCTSYKDYQATMNSIKEAVKEMRTEARTTPTWLQYERETA
jgi:hypothetical protein